MTFLLGPFYGAIAIPSVTRCRSRCCCRRCRGHRCAGGVRQWRRATVATPGEWQCKTAQHFSNASRLFNYCFSIHTVTVNMHVTYYECYMNTHTHTSTKFCQTQHILKHLIEVCTNSYKNNSNINTTKLIMVIIFTFILLCFDIKHMSEYLTDLSSLF